ncbi:hypothetical protein EDD16DRAFT_158724 [Pisolithus croceorrhizus]|nr:hypothetical protein EDD16DRAFT_158724 [Pisolithus croceorrhizus]
MGNCWVEFYETSGGDSDVRGELGDRGNRENGAPNPEIFHISSYSAFLQRMGDIYRCAGPVMTKGIPFESYRRVGLESQIARGTDERSSRYRVGEAGDDKGTWLPDTCKGDSKSDIFMKERNKNTIKRSQWATAAPCRLPRTCMKVEVCGCGCATFSSRLTHEYYEMTESRRRQRLLFSRLAGWWAGLEWAHPSNFLVSASMQVAVQVVARGYSSTGSHGGSRGNRGCASYLNTSTSVGCRGHESGREVQGCTAYLNKSTHAGHRDHESGREVNHESLM